MSFAVRDFYLNSGSQAVVVRLFEPFFASDADRTAAQAAAQAVADAAATAAGAGGATPASVATAARTEADAPANATEPRRGAADFVADDAETAAALRSSGGTELSRVRNS